MGSLRMVPREKEPGFIRFQVEPEPKLAEDKSHLRIRTKMGTEIQISREMPLKQVARLVKMIEDRGSHGLG